jgi:hypothetical protein
MAIYSAKKIGNLGIPSAKNEDATNVHELDPKGTSLFNH